MAGGIEVVGNGVGRHGLNCNEGDDCPSCWVGYCLENISAHAGSNFYFKKPIGCKYMRNQSVSQNFFKVVLGEGGQGVAITCGMVYIYGLMLTMATNTGKSKHNVFIATAKTKVVKPYDFNWTKFYEYKSAPSV